LSRFGFPRDHFSTRRKEGLRFGFDGGGEGLRIPASSRTFRTTCRTKSRTLAVAISRASSRPGADSTICVSHSHADGMTDCRSISGFDLEPFLADRASSSPATSGVWSRGWRKFGWFAPPLPRSRHELRRVATDAGPGFPSSPSERASFKEAPLALEFAGCRFRGKFHGRMSASAF
jgi:hypothetical protein